MAALKVGGTRVAAAGSYQFPDEQLLDLDACKPVDDNQVRVEALKIHDGYKQSCKAIATLGLRPTLSNAEKQKHTARVHAR